MNIISTFVLILTGISVFIGLFHLIFYYRNRELYILWFSLLSFLIALYDGSCAGLYHANNFVTGMFWQKTQFASLNVISISFVWFSYYFLEFKNKLIPQIFTFLFSIILILGVIIKNDLTLSIKSTSQKVIKFGSIFHHEIFEATPGVIYFLEYILIILGLIYIFISFFKKKENMDSKHKKVFFICFLMFSISGINDILVGLNFYQFIYTFEYSFIFIIFFMSYLLIDQHMHMFANISNMNILLEEKVKKRTEDLEKAYKKITRLNNSLEKKFPSELKNYRILI